MATHQTVFYIRAMRFVPPRILKTGLCDRRATHATFPESGYDSTDGIHFPQKGAIVGLVLQ